MRRSLIAFGLAGVVVLAAAGGLSAREPGVHFGLGVGMGKEIDITPLERSPVPLVSADFPRLYFPIGFSRFRLEPEIGLYWYFLGENDDVSVVLPLGLGAFWRESREKVDLYFGLRFEVTCWWLRDASDGDIVIDDKRDFTVGPAAGAEYYFTDSLSLGGEVQLLYTRIGALNTYGYYQDPGNVLKTRTQLLLRWYFSAGREKP